MKTIDPTSVGSDSLVLESLVRQPVARCVQIFAIDGVRHRLLSRLHRGTHFASKKHMILDPFDSATEATETITKTPPIASSMAAHRPTIHADDRAKESDCRHI